MYNTRLKNGLDSSECGVAFYILLQYFLTWTFIVDILTCSNKITREIGFCLRKHKLMFKKRNDEQMFSNMFPSSDNQMQWKDWNWLQQAFLLLLISSFLFLSFVVSLLLLSLIISKVNINFNFPRSPFRKFNKKLSH